MGVLRYHNEDFSFDDRLLAHMQVVISTKLRRGENFFLTWALPADAGSGRHALWVDNGVPIHITYSGSRPPSLNREWIEHLILTSAGGAVHLNDDPPPTSVE
ncbi:MAG: hypothetical protein KIT89_12610 [Microcella sp.]|uniref:DUF7882 family protein n=1 Tax=Microcella sp. TaxID=1913979 RepID=UPI0024C84F83|nr:hypothetical protein [Microcella sp.]UYN83504.1 MAG: hypothetical protein KIT89_12610 [Microcella sp.]